MQIKSIDNKTHLGGSLSYELIHKDPLANAQEDLEGQP